MELLKRYMFWFFITLIIQLFISYSLYVTASSFTKFYIGTSIISGIYLIISSFCMMFGGAGENKDHFFLVFIGISFIVGPFLFPVLQDIL